MAISAETGENIDILLDLKGDLLNIWDENSACTHEEIDEIFSYSYVDLVIFPGYLNRDVGEPAINLIDWWT